MDSQRSCIIIYIKNILPFKMYRVSHIFCHGSGDSGVRNVLQYNQPLILSRTRVVKNCQINYMVTFRTTSLTRVNRGLGNELDWAIVISYRLVKTQFKNSYKYNAKRVYSRTDTRIQHTLYVHCIFNRIPRILIVGKGISFFNHNSTIGYLI